MTSRTQPQYPTAQIIERCSCITLDELLDRGGSRFNPMFKRLTRLISNAIAHDCGAHLLEWPDGTLVLVVSQRASEFSQLPQEVIAAAYQYSISGSGLIYRDNTRSEHE